MYTKTYFFITLLLIFFAISCNTTSNNEPVKPPILSLNNAPTIQIQRFEQQLFALDTLNYEPSIQNLKTKYNTFFPFFAKNIMNWQNNAPTADKQVLSFIRNKDIKMLYDSCMHTYKNLNFLEKQLSQAFAYYQHYCGANRKIPEFYSYISAFSYGVVTVDSSFVGIGLDMFMGKNFDIYRSINMPRYAARKCTPEHLPANVMKAYVQGLYEISKNETKFIDQIVYEGKLLYFLDLTLPETPDSLKIGFRQQDLEWCKANEANMWIFLIDNKLLYNSNERDYYKLINDAPTTSGMPPESPGRAVIWTGWQIVRNFMAKNPNTTFEQLMNIKSGQKILEASQYKPI